MSASVGELLDKWMADPTSYDEEMWPKIREGLEGTHYAALVAQTKHEERVRWITVLEAAALYLDDSPAGSRADALRVAAGFMRATDAAEARGAAAGGRLGDGDGGTEGAAPGGAGAASVERER